MRGARGVEQHDVGEMFGCGIRRGRGRPAFAISASPARSLRQVFLESSANSVTEPMTEDVITRIEGAVGRITLNRPKALHALNLAMCEAIIEALLAWRADPAVRMIMLD